MEITYQDNSHCLSCFGHDSPKQNLHSQSNQHFMSQIRHSESNRFTKISLKKTKNIYSNDKQPSLSYSRVEPLTFTPEPLQFLPQQLVPMKTQHYSSVQLHSAGNYSQFRNSCNTNYDNFTKQNLSHTLQMQKEPLKIGWTPRIRQKRESELTETAKIVKDGFNFKEQLCKTKKIIPEQHHSLQQLSLMKHSVISICQRQEINRFEESVILVDFFNPSSSRAAQLAQNQKRSQSQLISIRPQ